jgi:2-polyprenyl-3-methyl-5-hydroxy-6-metoxy-1,4-benzoquinol methylase
MQCRFCKSELTQVFIDLLNSPASNSFLNQVELSEPEIFYPLKVFTCTHCWLVQIEEYKKSEAIFDGQYAYFSSYSSSWLKHAKDYTRLMIHRFGLNEESRVVEIASNDGYLLQYFKEKGIPVLGIEPTSNTAEVAQAKGIETCVDFFGVRLARELAGKNIQADLLLGNNVLAHVPDILDFVGGMKIVLAPSGVITMEFPHLMKLVDNSQFDTIYHEHFSYLSLHTVRRIFESQDLSLFDVEELPTHGGSLRIYARHPENRSGPPSERVGELLKVEREKGMLEPAYYRHLQEKVLKIKLDLVEFLIEQKRAGKKVAAYGAAAKGNTLLNYCGVKNDWIEFVVDANPHKQGKWLPGSHIPVWNEVELRKAKPDWVIILPWNLKEEIIPQLHYIKAWGGRFVIPIPQLQLI